MLEPPRFEIESELVEGTARLTVVGELDIATVPRLDQEANALLRRSAQRLLIDLSGVTFIDSSGLNFFIALNNRATKEDWTLGLTRPPEQARSVFTVTGAEAYLPFEKATGSR
jgi:anti-sigma B factor antagonist